MTYSVTIDISAQTIAYTVVLALEGDSIAWCEHIDLNHHYYEKAETYKNPFTFIVTHRDGRVTIMNNASTQRGIELMASEYPTDFADMMQGQGDATTSDIFFQLCTMGEVFYG